MAYNKLSTYKTKIIVGANVTAITYHSTPIVSFDENKIILRTGGYRSVTTKRKMNQASIQFDLGYGVLQQKGEWYIVFNKPGSIGYDLTRKVLMTSEVAVIDRKTKTVVFR